MMERKYVSLDVDSQRMFKSEFLNALTKVHFTVPVILYCPVIIYLYYLAIASPELSWLQILFLSFAGLISWSLVEYGMHRFIFHYEPKSNFGKKVYFLFHGVHHDFPNDKLRLVFPPSVSIPLSILFFFFFNFWISKDHIYPFFGAFLLGYLVYDMLHYAIHHLELSGKLWSILKSNHLKHHFVDNSKGFGVSSTAWDYIAGSNFPKKKRKTEDS